VKTVVLNCRERPESGLLAWLRCRFAGRRSKSLARRELLDLNDHLLRDIGLTREQVERDQWFVDAEGGIHGIAPSPGPARTMLFHMGWTVVIAAVCIVFFVLTESDFMARATGKLAAACTGVKSELTLNGIAPKQLQYCSVSTKGLPLH